MRIPQLTGRRSLILSCVVLIAAVAGYAGIQSSDEDRKVREFNTQLTRRILRGVPGVEVRIQLSSNAGLREDDIRTAVELQLRKAGIRVLTPDELKKTLTGPNLCVWLTANMDKQEDIGLYIVHVAYREAVTVLRDEPILTVADLWERRSIGQLKGPSSLKDLKEKVLNMVDTFANEYLAANQPEKAPR